MGQAQRTHRFAPFRLAASCIRRSSPTGGSVASLLDPPYSLIRHNPTARKWTVGITGFCLATIALMLVYAAIVGTDGMSVTIATRIKDPPFWIVAAVAMGLLVLFAIPLCLLLTPKARQEFGVAPGV
mgnify:FL=1